MKGGGVEWSDGGRGREGGGCGVKGEWYSHIIPLLLLVGGRLSMWGDGFRMWAIGFMHGWLFSYQAVVFVSGQLSGQSFPFVSSHLHTWAVGGCPHGCCLGCPCGGDGYAGCHCCHGRMLVVLLPHCHG